MKVEGKKQECVRVMECSEVFACLCCAHGIGRKSVSVALVEWMLYLMACRLFPTAVYLLLLHCAGCVVVFVALVEDWCLCSSIYFAVRSTPRKPFCVAQTMVLSCRVFKMLYVTGQSARLAIRVFITVGICSVGNVVYRLSVTSVEKFHLSFYAFVENGSCCCLIVFNACQLLPIYGTYFDCYIYDLKQHFISK